MRLFFSIAAALFVVHAHGQYLPKADQRVDAVTVYFRGALITQKATFDLRTGENELRLTGIPASIDVNSIGLNAPNDDYLITGMRHELNHDGGLMHPLGRAKKDSLELARFTMGAKQAMRMAYTEELLMLQANRTIGGKNSVLLAEDLAEMADFYRERVKEINYRTLEINDEERELNKRIQRLERELRDMKALTDRNNRVLIVTLRGKKNAKSELFVTYFAHEAGWEVFYDLRSDGVGEPAQLVSKARVRQHTGADWAGVKLSLSTGTPSFGGQPPVLQPWRLYIMEPVQTARNEAMRSQAPSAAKAFADDAMAEMVEETFVFTEQRQQLNTRFTLSSTYSITGDNRAHEVEVKTMSIPVGYRHFVVPKLSEDVYLTAEMTDWDQYNLLPGDASIYFEGSYVGKSPINPQITTDTMSISLGKDRNVTVQYEQVKDFTKTSTIGAKRRTTRGYRIKVMNTGVKPIRVRIEDQLPLSTTSDIEVELEELSGGKHNASSGKITWDEAIEPGRLVEKLLKYQVRYPRKKVISGL
jgi:uncharacterized protein (TIGR02231 family)